MIKSNEINFQQKVRINEVNSSFQLLKFILSLFVVFFHVFLSSKFLNPLIIIPVNTFAIISGYFLAVKNNKFRALQFVPTLLFLWAFNIFLNLLFALIFNYFNQLNWLSILLTGNNWSWWYLSGITIIYIFSPMLNYIILNTKKYFLVIAIFIIWLSFQIYTYFLSNRFLWIIPLFYCYLIGGFIRVYLAIFIKNKKHTIYIVTIFIFSIMFILNTVYLKVLNANSKFNFLASENINSPCVVVLASMFFLTFATFKFKYNKFIDFLGKLSLFIFTYHMFFYLNFINITGLTYHTEIVIIFVLSCTFLLSIVLYFPFIMYSKHINSLVRSFLYYKWVNKLNWLLNLILFTIVFGCYIAYFFL